MLYDKDGALDLEVAARRATELGAVRNRDIRAGLSAELTIAALLDIAGSLRVLALEVLEARGAEYPPPVASVVDGSEAPMRARTLAEHVARGEPADGWLEPGDVVWILGVPREAHVLDVGVSEGEPWAALAFDEVPGEPAVRGWQRDLKLAGTDAAADAEAPALRVEDDGGGEEISAEEHAADLLDSIEPEDLVDDIDDDFDGDTHNAAADAVAQLATNEAARKAKKKGGKK